MPIGSFVSALAALGGTGMAMVKGLRDDKQSRYPPDYFIMRDMMKMMRKGYPMGMMYNPYRFPMYQPQQFQTMYQPQYPMCQPQQFQQMYQQQMPMYSSQMMYQPQYPMCQSQQFSMPPQQYPIMFPTQNMNMMVPLQAQSDVICQMLQQQLQMQFQQQQMLNQLYDDMRKRMLLSQYQPYVQEMIHPRTYVVPQSVPIQTAGPIWEDDTGKQAVYPAPKNMPIPLTMMPEPIAYSQQAPKWEDNPNIPKNYVGNRW